jgi:hypothetical protein
MKEKNKLKKGRFFKFLFFLIFIIILIPVILVAVSFIGKISPESLLPDSFDLYVRVFNVARCADNLLEHESLPDILSLKQFSSMLPAVSKLKDSGLTKKLWFKFAASGTLDCAFFADNKFLAAWDSGIISSFFKIAPWIAGSVTSKNLYYVQAGKKSRFEYRLEKGDIIFIGKYKNLIIASNNSKIFESALNDPAGQKLQGNKKFYSNNYDIAVLAASSTITSAITGSANSVKNLDFPGFAEAGISFGREKIDVAVISPVSSNNININNVIENNSKLSSLVQILPDTTHYATVVSGNSIENFLNAFSAAGVSSISEKLKTADSSSRMLFNIGIDELLFSWSGMEVAVFALEGYLHPVFAMQIEDEQKRKEIFEKVFSSSVINEDIYSVLDGVRIPQIKLPYFIDSLLKMVDINVPAPYYIIESNFLFISESSVSLLAAVNAVHKRSVLAKTALWRNLSESSSNQSIFTLFYSLDRSLPFFLRGNTSAVKFLRLYKQGLMRVNINDKIVTAVISAIPGAGKGVLPADGYPIAFKDKISNEIYGVFSSKRGESRIVFSEGKSAVSVDPVLNKIYRFIDDSPVFVVPVEETAIKNITDAAVWVVNSKGTVSLLNGNMEQTKDFPVITGCRLSSAPAASNGKLFLPDLDKSVYMVDSMGKVEHLPFVFDAALKTPPSIANISRKTYMASYPKSFSGQIWLSDISGNIYEGWPAEISGIAFGSPVIFTKNSKPFVAFITQAGEFFVFNEKGDLATGFPIELPGVFFIQPAYDGEFLWAVSEKGEFFKISFDGNILSQKIEGLTVREGFITTADIDKDGKAEIFFTGSGNALYGYSSNFAALSGFPLPVWGKPVFGDFDGDGKMECAGTGLDNKLYRWHFR